MKKFIVIIFVFTCISLNLLTAQPRNTSSFVTAGADVNGILYFANFKQFEGVENCCSSFKNSFGLNYNIHAGYELELAKPWLGMKLRLDLSVDYAGLSATFQEQNPFANIITGNSYTKAVSEYKIEPRINVFKLDPGLYFYPFESIPVAFRLGLQAGFLLGKTYTQSETLISPTNAFFENGTKLRGVRNGSIPNSASMIFALSGGIRYEVYKFGNFTINPEFRFNYGLNNLVSGLNWKASEIQAGVSITYNIPKAQLIPPMPPPVLSLPDVPQPPQPGKLDLTIKTTLNGNDINSNEIKLSTRRIVNSKTNHILPIIFYKQSTTEKIDPEEDNQYSNKLINLISDYMIKNPEITMTLKSTNVENEDNSIVEKRISDLVSHLSANISIKRINIEKNQFIPGKEPIEIVEENSNIKFVLSDGTTDFKYTENISEKNEYTQKENILLIKPVILADSSYNFDGSIISDGMSTTLPLTGTTINLTNSIEPKASSYSIKAEISDNFNRHISKQLNINVVPEITETIIHDNEETDGNSVYSEYTLSYFNFDEYEISSTNIDVAQLAITSLNEGKKIILIPSTDIIGTEKYNKTLAVNRAKSAIEIIKGNNLIDTDLISIVYPDRYKYSNSTPTGRYMNRSVHIRIYK